MQSERKTFCEVISYFKLQLRGKGEGKFRESKQAIRSVLDGGQKGWAKTSLIQWANKQPLVGGKNFFRSSQLLPSFGLGPLKVPLPRSARKLSLAHLKYALHLVWANLWKFPRCMGSLPLIKGFLSLD